MCSCFTSFLFFFNDTATTEIYTLSLHDALPIYLGRNLCFHPVLERVHLRAHLRVDRKSTRLNSSHSQISYAVFCLKKKKRTLGDFEVFGLAGDVAATVYSRTARPHDLGAVLGAR